MVFSFSPTLTDLLYLKMPLDEWLLTRVWGRTNASSAYHGLQMDINSFSMFPLVTQVSVSVAGGVEGLFVPGVAAPPIAIEIEAPTVEITVDTLFHIYKKGNYNFTADLLNSFAPADFPPAMFDFFILFRDFGGGFYIENCAPQRLSIQFNMGQLATLSCSFVGNYILFLPQGSVYYGGSRGFSGDVLAPTNFSSVLEMNPEAAGDKIALKILNLSFTVNNNISFLHAVPFQTYSDTGEYSNARRAPRLLNLGFQTVELSFRAIAPENASHSIIQTPAPTKSLRIECYDSTMENFLGEFNFAGKFVDWRVTVAPQNQIAIDWRKIAAGTPIWSFTPAP